MSNTKVVRVAQIVRPAEGGIRRHVSLLTAGLDRKQFAPSVYAPADFTLDTPLKDVPQYPVAIGARTDIAADLRAIGSLTKLLQGNADLVHAHGLRAALIGVLAARRAGIPSLFTAHNLVPPLGRLQRVLLRHIGRMTGRILAVSQAVADTLIPTGIAQSKIHVVPNGVDIALFDISTNPAETRILYNIPADAPLIVGIGRLSPEKGFELLVGSFDSVVSRVPAAHLLLVGDGPERHPLLTLANALPCKEQIHFAGRVADVIPILHAADVIAVPSREEGQGIVALEAMAACKPVVATRVGGLVETIVPDVTGFLRQHLSDFMDSVVFLLQNPQRAQEMGREGRKRVEQEYTAERMIHNIETVYRSLVTA
jgi:glycosyltransferase involved in cell wall biosynthesis